MFAFSCQIYAVIIVLTVSLHNVFVVGFFLFLNLVFTEINVSVLMVVFVLTLFQCPQLLIYFIHKLGCPFLITFLNFYFFKSWLVSLFCFAHSISILFSFLVALFLFHWYIQHTTQIIITEHYSAVLALTLMLTLFLQLTYIKVKLLTFSQSSFVCMKFSFQFPQNRTPGKNSLSPQYLKYFPWFSYLDRGWMLELCLPQ